MPEDSILATELPMTVQNYTKYFKNIGFFFLRNIGIFQKEIMKDC